MSITGIGHRVPGLQPLCAVSATMPNSPLRPCLETSCPVLVRGCGRCDQHKHLAPSRFANAQRGTAAATGDRSALAQRGARRAARVAAGVGTEDGCTDATRWPEGAGPKIGPRVRWTGYCVSVVAVKRRPRRAHDARHGAPLHVPHSYVGRHRAFHPRPPGRTWRRSMIARPMTAGRSRVNLTHAESRHCGKSRLRLRCFRRSQTRSDIQC